MTYRGRGMGAEAGGIWTVEGELTIRDVTRTVPLAGPFIGHMSDKSSNIRAAYEASARIKRGDFGLTAELAAESGGTGGLLATGRGLAGHFAISRQTGIVVFGSAARNHRSRPGM